MPFSRRLYGAISLSLITAGFLILALLVFASLWFSNQIRVHNHQVVLNESAISSANSALALIERTEAARRGFLLRQTEGYARVVDMAQDQIKEPLGKLKNALTTLGLGDLYTTAETLTDRRMAEIDASIQMVRSGDLEGARNAFGQTDGQADLVSLRKTIADIVGQEEAELQGGLDRAANSAQYFFITAVLVVIVMLALAVAFYFLIRRYTAELNSSAAELERLNLGLEDAVQERTADLQHANSEIQRYAYIVSHDLRSPLVNIMGFTSELETGLSDVQAMVAKIEETDPEVVTPEAKVAVQTDWPEAIGFIRKATDKMDRLINAILKLSREGRRVFTPQRLSMTEFVTALADATRHQANEADAEIKIEPLPDIISDRVAIEQIFSNLIDNAVKYLKRNEAGLVKVSAKDLGRNIEFVVRDNGRGIQANDLDRIFDLFRRSGVQDRPGEGIGLAHVRAVVRRLGGTITCESVLGEGTTFRVVLPKVLRHEERERE
ncbi:CHASE3 domain-containing protein [Faunimonas pinastri]|uniref:histidine kinase n=1 Tax=Faunimonas pinastri TaxID=1855383 RepID=A0A1H9A3W9_9HYPH|nr:ATP-binding protein [Faunimonas pinastri]SEP71354.1 CHASE3 domain-containing protein [Faunimonas pinastri]